jgi:hypothetical protein
MDESFFGQLYVTIHLTHNILSKKNNFSSLYSKESSRFGMILQNLNKICQTPIDTIIVSVIKSCSRGYFKYYADRSNEIILWISVENPSSENDPGN